MAEKAGVISQLNGTITVERDGETVILREGDTVLEGDKITTKGTQVEITLEDGSALTLDGHSEATITEAPSSTDGKATIVVTVGTATYQSSTSVDANPDDVLIVTPTSTISVGDASVSIEISDNGELNVTNLANESGDYGTVTISTEGGEVTLDSKNTTSTVTSSDSAPTAPEPVQEVRVEAVAEAVENVFEPEDDAPTSNANEESAIAEETFVPPPAEVIVTEPEPVFTPEPIVEDFDLSNDDFVFVKPEPDPEPVNTAPSASDLLLTINEDGEVIITEAQLLANVVDIEGDTSIVSVTGAIDNNDGTFTLTPETDFNGTITLDYTVSDGQYTDTAKIIIEVLPVNDAPEVGDVEFSMDEDTSFTFTSEELLANAADIDGDNLTLVSVNGAVDNGDGTWTFTPEADFFGEVNLSFTVSDGATTTVGTVIIDVIDVTEDDGEDDDKGHGNDDDGVDDDNPGQGGGGPNSEDGDGDSGGGNDDDGVDDDNPGQGNKDEDDDLGYTIVDGEITFTGSDLDFDIDDFDEEPITKIDITGTGNNKLKVEARDVKDAGGEITITGNTGDTVNLFGKWDEGNAVVIDGVDFTTYEGKDATIFIMDDLSII